jgi:hypothetical protein
MRPPVKLSTVVKVSYSISYYFMDSKSAVLGLRNLHVAQFKVNKITFKSAFFFFFCILLIVGNVSFIVCVVSCAVFCLSIVCYLCDMCILADLEI